MNEDLKILKTIVKICHNYLQKGEEIDFVINERHLQAIENVLEERKKDKTKLKELERSYFHEKLAKEEVEELLECSIPKQKVKDIAKQIQEEYNKVQEQFDCIWNKKSKDNYDRYKLQELSAMQQELGFILGKFEKLLEEGE